MKKNFSLRIFNLLAKRVYKLSKKRKLGWTWRDCQRWTSANLFKLYKGKAISKIKVTEVDSVIVGILDSAPVGTMPTPAPQKEVCDSVFQIPTSDLEPVNWWNFPDVVNSFPPLVNINIELPPFISTGITKRNLLPDLNRVREDFRKVKTSSEIIIVFKILVRPKRKDDGSNCSYYILATFEDSELDISTKDDEIDVFVSEEDLSAEVKAERKMKEQQKESEKKVTKKEIKGRERPQQVETKAVSEDKISLEAERYKQLNIALDGLREDFKLGLITKKQYQARQQILLKKFENGGKI